MIIYGSSPAQAGDDYYRVGTSNVGSNIAGYTDGITPDVTNPNNVFIEDLTNTNASSSSLGPYRGGQDYDAEFMAAYVEDGSFYLGILTGQRYDNEDGHYGPGDIYLVVSNDGDVDNFGIEVGGRMSETDEKIGLGEDGATYKLRRSGRTKVVS